MPWVRVGDNAATYPRLLQIAGFPGADARTVNEVFGFVLRCATQSAGHLTDYVVDVGTAQMIGGTRTRKLIGWCVQAGLLTPVKVKGVEQYVIVNDDEFIHIRTKQEIEWERTQRSDTRDPGLIVQVRLRDGDNCRWCGVLVKWTGRKSNRSAVYDHLKPGEAATVDTLVVACVRHNSARKANPQWEVDHPLRPAPARPNYEALTARFLTENGYDTTPNTGPDATTSASSADTAAPARSDADNAPYIEERPAPDFAAGARPAARPVEHPTGEGVETQPKPAPNAVPDSVRTSCAGSGRDGQGQAGPGPGPGTQAGPGPGTTTPGPARRRRRGNRGRKTNPTPTQHPGGETS